MYCRLTLSFTNRSSSSWSPSTSSLSPPSASRYFSCFWYWPVTGVAFCCNVTARPTAEWTGQQLREAFPFDQVPSYLLRDRDAIFGDEVREQVRDMGIHEVLSAPRSPWQRAYVERVIGSIRDRKSTR